MSRPAPWQQALKELKDGTEALANGTTQLVEKGSLLTDGTSQLAAGAEKISDGSGQLADGSSQLNAGLISLLSGTNELGAKLSEGSAALNEVDATESTYAMMAEPVITNQIETAPVANNGTGDGTLYDVRCPLRRRHQSELDVRYLHSSEIIRKMAAVGGPAKSQSFLLSASANPSSWSHYW